MFMKRSGSLRLIAFIIAMLIGCLRSASAQQKTPHDLSMQLQALTAGYKATIGVSMLHLESGEALSLHDEHYYPMQSVFKFPLALAVLHEVDEGRLSLGRNVRLTAKDVKQDTWSPLKEAYPTGNVDVTIETLLGYAISHSDNIACDLLFGVMGGTEPVNKYIHSLGVTDISIAATEREMHRRWNAQYDNGCRPSAMTALLKGLQEGKYLSAHSNRMLLRWMTDATTGMNRIRGHLPAGVPVADKTGTSGTRKGIRGACNDVGIITLPNGTHLALTVFISDSRESQESDEQLIANIAKVVYEHYRYRR